MDQINAFSGKPLNASLWLNFYSFDVMGDLAFGQSFDMLRSGEKVGGYEYLTSTL
jgi:tryprostatin B 6-hydroxylase